MTAAWSNEDDSSNESSEDEKVDLMANHEVTSPPSTSHSFMSNSRLTDDDELSHEDLVEALSQVCYKLKLVNKEKKSLQKFLKSLLFEKESLKKIF